jgi:hypothetical protein
MTTDTKVMKRCQTIVVVESEEEVMKASSSDEEEEERGVDGVAMREAPRLVDERGVLVV